MRENGLAATAEELEDQRLRQMCHILLSQYYLFVRKWIQYLNFILYLFRDVDVTSLIILCKFKSCHHVFDVEVDLHQLLRHLLVRLVVVEAITYLEEMHHAVLVDAMRINLIEDLLHLVLEEWKALSLYLQSLLHRFLLRFVRKHKQK